MVNIRDVKQPGEQPTWPAGRALLRWACLLTGTACIASARPSEQPTPGVGMVTVRSDSVLTIIERIEFENQDLRRAQLGRIAIAARSTEEPTRNIADARVRLRVLNDTSRTLRRISVPSEGGRLDSLPVGGYLLEVGIPFFLGRDTTRLWSRVDVPLEVRPGCTAYVEVYLRTGYRICEYGACPMPREHATLTVCREA